MGVEKRISWWGVTYAKISYRFGNTKTIEEMKNVKNDDDLNGS
jgi:hypothetical protein